MAASPAPPEEGQAGAEGGGFPWHLLTPALGGPHRSSARGTQRSGLSSQSSTSLPPCCSAHSSITWVAGSWVRACPGPAGVGGLRDLASQETLGLCPLTETLGESLGTEFMRPWHSCASEGPGPSLLAQRRGWDERAPGPLSTFRSRRLGDLPSHPPRALHGLHSAVQRASLRGTCSAPGPLLCLRSFLQPGVGVGGAKLMGGVGRGRAGRGGAGRLGPPAPFRRWSLSPVSLLPSRTAWCCWSWATSSTGRCESSHHLRPRAGWAAADLASRWLLWGLWTNMGTRIGGLGDRC